ncbi:uncharacterized protein LOC132267652 [Cornus florida]|uniref:uncharacterized protein LOC132267652 n=1 Tax=Cornus florida TaxID=4283 RepID=UPI0028981E1D|nr:uncharacterized protein LOC132267652 [Cornus florida]
MEDQSSETEAERLLRVSEYFLRHRNFESSRRYALIAQGSDPHNPRAAQLLTIAAVLDAAETRISSNNRADWYAILQVNRYLNDSHLIKNQFKHLILLLNPKQNKSDFASEAFELVHEAWAVLSSPLKKPQFDKELKMLSEGKCGLIDETFWTVCPYCYHVYEYPRVYVDCCLRCDNQNCRRGFHAVVLPSPPPPELAEDGKYWCWGFFPVGFEGGERKGFPSWTPFAPFCMGTPKTEGKEKNAVPESGDTDSFINISDDSDDDGLGNENGGASENVNAEKAKTEEVKKMGGSSNGCATKRVETEASNVAKPAMKRKKSVAKHSKKLMGKGTRILKQEMVPSQRKEEFDLNVVMASRGDLSVDDGVEFFDGEDDVYVGLQDDF